MDTGITTLKRLVVAGFAALVLSVGFAADQYWYWDGRTDGTTVLNAPDLLDPNGWTSPGEFDPAADRLFVYQNAGSSALTSRRFAFVSADTTFSKLKTGGSSQVTDVEGKLLIVVSDGVIRNGNSDVNAGALFYSSFDQNGKWNTKIVLAGDCRSSALSADAGLALRPDLYATAAGGDRTLTYPSESYVTTGNWELYAPRSSKSAITATFVATAGKPYFLPAAGFESVWKALPVGTTVTVADGSLADGTFLKRIFPDGSIELSSVAAADGEVALTFAPQTAKLRANIAFKNGGATIRMMKSAPEDDVEITCPDFYPLNTTKVHTLDCAEGFYPALVRVGTVKAGAEYVLGTCCVGFTTTKQTGGMGFVGTSSVRQKAAGSQTEFVVDEGQSATVANFKDVIGRVTKSGAGTLSVTFADTAANTGAVVVAEGTLVLPAGGHVATLSIAADATISLGADLTVGDLDLAEGAIVDGPGAIRLSGGAAYLSSDVKGVVFTNGGRVACDVGVGGVLVDPDAVPAVVGHPAFWVDASNETSLVTVPENGTNFVTRWNDCRPGEPMFCTNVFLRPQLVKGDTWAGNYVRIGKCPTARYYRDSEQLVWNVPVQDIRAVFLVQDPTDGGGDILGRTSRLSNNHYGSRGGPYFRNNRWDLSLISKDYGTDCVVHGRFFLDGEEVDCTHGYLGTRLQLVEHHVNADYRASASYKELSVDAFGTGYAENTDEFAIQNGGMRIAECIVYTNSLTYAERVRVAHYLMRKWLGKDVAPARYDVNSPAVVGAAVAGHNADLNVEAGKECVFTDMTAGEGTVRKTGAGTVYLANLTSGAIEIKEGKAIAWGLSLANTKLPGTPWMHVDADDATTIVGKTTAEGVRKVERWNEVGGDPTACASFRYNSSYWQPTVKEDAQNGRPVVSMGPLGGSGRAMMQYYNAAGATFVRTSSGVAATEPKVKDGFFVFSAAGGGGALLGAGGSYYPRQGFPHDGTAADTPMIYEPTYTTMLNFEGFSDAIKKGTATFTLNGTAINPLETPYSTSGCDLLWFHWETGRTGDILASYNGKIGGLDYGEVILYSNVLASADSALVNAYLNKKWFDRDTVGCSVAKPTSLTVAAGAEFALENGEIVETDLLGGGGTVTAGEVVLADGGIIEADISGNALAALAVSGKLTLAGAGTIRIRGDIRALAAGSHAVVTAGDGFVGDLSQWTVEVVDGAKRCTVTPCAINGSVGVFLAKPGLLLFVR